ncbi:MAG: type II toxin-antitoxin system RelE/ParE family toxin [Patescibacteria group bacterium]|jgi:phage-related protein
MIYSEEYKIKFYRNSRTGEEPVLDYLKQLDLKDRQKINKYIDFLRDSYGYLDEPYSRHITGKIRELRVDFSNKRHRILYFSFFGKTIVLLSAFLKNTGKTPGREIYLAEKRYNDFINNYKLYEN